MLKDQADQVCAALCKQFRGRQIEIVTSGNEDAREAGIDQHYKVRLDFFKSGPARQSAIEREDAGQLLSIAEAAETEDDPIDVDFKPRDAGGLFGIRVVFD